MSVFRTSNENPRLFNCRDESEPLKIKSNRINYKLYDIKIIKNNINIKWRFIHFFDTLYVRKLIWEH